MSNDNSASNSSDLVKSCRRVNQVLSDPADLGELSGGTAIKVTCRPASAASQQLRPHADDLHPEDTGLAARSCTVTDELDRRSIADTERHDGRVAQIEVRGRTGELCLPVEDISDLGVEVVTSFIPPESGRETLIDELGSVTDGGVG